MERLGGINSELNEISSLSKWKANSNPITVHVGVFFESPVTSTQICSCRTQRPASLPIAVQDIQSIA